MTMLFRNKPAKARSTSSLCRRGCIQRDEGSALLMSIILIFMLSIIGVSAMRSSTLEHQMASNALFARDVFQAAESSNEMLLNDTANLGRALTRCSVSLVTPLREDIGLRSQATLRHVGEGNAAGYSLDASQNAATISAQRYIVEGVASIDSVRTSRRIEQGASRPAPSNNIQSGSSC